MGSIICLKMATKREVICGGPVNGLAMDMQARRELCFLIGMVVGINMVFAVFAELQ